MKPPQFDRLVIKKQVLEKFPLLDCTRIEIITPNHALDSLLLDGLDDGNLEGGLTDQLFFECLAQTPDYLAFEPFRKRVKEWQEILHDPFSSKDARAQAKDNLKEVGNVLAMQPQGRPSCDLPGFILRNKCDQIEALLIPFLAATKTLTPGEKAAAFREEFPLWSEYTGLLKKHHASLELAKQIICCQIGISRTKLHSLLETIP